MGLDTECSQQNRMSVSLDESFSYLICEVSIPGSSHPPLQGLAEMSPVSMYSSTAHDLFSAARTSGSSMLGIERAYTARTLLLRVRFFVTQSRVLVGKVEEGFLKYLESLSAVSSGHQNTFQRIRNHDMEDEFIIDEDDDENWRSDLPQRYNN